MAELNDYLYLGNILSRSEIESSLIKVQSDLEIVQATLEDYTETLNNPDAETLLSPQERDSLTADLAHAREEENSLLAIEEDLSNFLADIDRSMVDPIIHEDYFQTYAEGLAADMVNMSLSSWPLSCIDWNQAVNELRQDYTALEIDGTTYYGK